MENQTPLSRRGFIQQTALGAAATAAFTSAPSVGVAGANERINIGVIGLGTIAKNHAKKLAEIKDEDNCTIVAICDIWDQRFKDYIDGTPHFKGVKELFGNVPTQYRDYRELIHDPKVDKVLVATPEHWHERMAIEACKAGKAVYCEKPMTHSAEEAVRVLKAIEENGTIFQVGVQGMSDDSYISARKVIEDGMLGQVFQCQIDYVRRYSENSGPWRTQARTGDPKPADLDWDAFLGPAWKRPWDARRYFDWRNYWDYSGGVSTDLFVHRITRMIKACNLVEPIRGIGMGGIYKWNDGREVPDSFEMLLEYEDGPTVYCLGTMGNKYGNKHCIRGYNATLVFEDPGFNVYSQKNDDYGKVIYTHKKTGAENQALHHKNHHAAMRANDPGLLNCPPELGYYGVVAVGLANEGYKLKKCMTWDAKRKRVVPA